MRKQAYSILVYNNPGLLSRMAGLFSRRGTILKVLPQVQLQIRDLQGSRS